MIPTIIRRSTFLIYLTILLSGLNSIWFEIITSDYAHNILSYYFFIEAAILTLTIVIGLRSKWIRMFVGILTAAEVVLFFQDRPVSPDESLMIIIFGLRVYILIALFSKPANQYYSQTTSS